MKYARCQTLETRCSKIRKRNRLMNQISQTEAELKAAMGGLRDARHEAEEMRAYIERMHANG